MTNSYKITPHVDHLAYVEVIAEEDAKGLLEAESKAGYAGSWKKRGGNSAYNIYVRKPDRIEQCVEGYGFDVFEALHNDDRKETVLDNIRDARRYLLLIEAEYRAQLAAKKKEEREYTKEVLIDVTNIGSTEPEYVKTTVVKTGVVDSRTGRGMEHPFGYEEEGE